MTQADRRRHEIRVGLLLLAAVAVFAWLALRIGGLGAFGDSVRVSARLTDAAGLVPDAAVKVAGVQVGRVERLEVDFDHALLTLRLDRAAGLRQDVRLAVRARSLLGEKYVALEPQSGDTPLLADGDRIERVAPPVEIDGLVQALGPLLAQVQPEDVRALVSGAARLTEAGAGELPALIEDLKAILAGAREAAALGPELRRDLPPLLAEARRATGDLRDLLAHADAAVGEVKPVADDARAAIGKVGPLLDRLDRDLAALEPGLDDAARALEASDELVARLQRIADDLDWLDRNGLRNLLREEGILVRLKPPKEGAER